MSSQSIKLFLPPLEVPLARFLVTTFASITWYVLRRDGQECSIDAGYDASKQLEYIEINCSGWSLGTPVDELISSRWDIDSFQLEYYLYNKCVEKKSKRKTKPNISITRRNHDKAEIECLNCDEQTIKCITDTVVKDLSGKIEDRTTARKRGKKITIINIDLAGKKTQYSLKTIAWDKIRLDYDESRQVIIYDAGGFPPPDYRWLQDKIFKDYVRYFYGRGFSLEALQDETPTRWRPVPQAGFIDFSMSDAIPFIYGLKRLREMLRIVAGDKVIQLLLADLGDKGLGLYEAIDTIYDVAVGEGGRGLINVSYKSIRFRYPARIGIDVLIWAKYDVLLSLIRSILEASLELIPRWPTLAIATYKAGRYPRGDETRSLNILVVSADEIFAALQGLKTAANELGKTSIDLARMMLNGLWCVTRLAERGAEEATKAGALASKLFPLVDSLLRGFVDWDLYFHVSRMLSQLSSKSYPEPCRWAAARA